MLQIYGDTLLKDIIFKYGIAEECLNGLPINAI